jgi:cbb3-type cytochrome oxidase subunit 3
MFKYILQNAGDINWIAVMALVLFFAVFLFGSAWILTKKKDYVDKVSRLPLDD